MASLSPALRSTLERAVVNARDEGERAAETALAALGVNAERTLDHLSEDERGLRRAMRAKQRQLDGFAQLVGDVAYEHWHRMLFARFLAENALLMHPDYGVPVTLAECEELAHAQDHGDGWLVAAEFASRMLPGIFRADEPVLQLRLPPEGQEALERSLASLPAEIFTSDDGLGWVYQYWQTKKKAEVNRSERKIGGADIAPVTQLFTEHYMVRFLLENSLGAWWAARHPESPLLAGFDYLRYGEEGKPAAGAFEGWPDAVAELTVMDPCCGSGHFLVTAFEMLCRMRMEAEGLSVAQAGDAVLRDNLFGLELDPRCTHIAAFALALAAWKTGGYRELPLPNIACSGISAAGRLEDWQRLARGDERLETALTRLHALFSEAAELGSLIDPLRETDGDLLAARFEEAAPLFEQALEREETHDPTAAVFGAAAAGAARAASLLARRYTLLVTNPPFLGQNQQKEHLKQLLLRRYPGSKHDLATCFIERNLSFCLNGGATAMVVPQTWLFLKTYRTFREVRLENERLTVLAWLGSGAFGEVSGEIVNVVLMTMTRSKPVPGSRFVGLDVAGGRGPLAKESALQRHPISFHSQERQRRNPQAIISLSELPIGAGIAMVADVHYGSKPGQTTRVTRVFWEVAVVDESRWMFMESTPAMSAGLFSGKSEISMTLDRVSSAGITEFGVRGSAAWNRSGIIFSKMTDMKWSLYLGRFYGDNTYTIVPHEDALLPAFVAYCEAGELVKNARALNRKLNVTRELIEELPFDADNWQNIAAEKYPEGLPKPHSDDPTQWLFNGHPRGSEAPLHVAVARLLGYRWPRQTGSEFPDCAALDPDGLQAFVDEDGVVCLPPVRGERPAAEGLRSLLAAAFAEKWSPAKEADLLAQVGYAGQALELWLRDGFFEQHCQLFHQRPFVWHLWDGRKDGFSALVNYHRLDRALLARLAYTYVNDWIDRQREAVRDGQPGSEQRLVAAEKLQERLALILEGEPPYDIFVRWKGLAEQPIGWQPDLDDGVRLNIRPFVTAGVLRKNPRVNWNKDRGKDGEDAPWYHVFKGERINDHHLTVAEKRAAQERATHAAMPA